MFDVLITIYSLAIVWLLGLLVMRSTRLMSDRRLYSVAVDFGVGAGFLYLLLFLSSLISGHFRPYMVYLTIALLGTVNILYPKRGVRLRWPTREESMSVSFIVAVAAFILIPTINTGLDGDGWAIWAFKATALFEDGSVKASFLMDMERYAYSHPDYPLLVPTLEYWVCVHLGHVNDHVIRLVPISFWLLMLLFFYSTLSERIKKHHAVLCTVLLALIWPITENAVLGLVDGVQAFYNMIGLVYIFSWLERSEKRDLWTAALVLGFGANVKNEGLGFLAAASVGLLLPLLYKRSYEKILFSIGMVFTGAIIAAPWVAEKKVYGIGSELFLKGVPYIGTIMDRLSILTMFYLQQVVNVGHAGWGLLWIFILAALARIAYSYKLREERYQVFLLICLLQVLILAGVYIITPYDLNYHLQTSGSRTLLQIVPAVFWIGVLAMFQEEQQEISR